jgi:hypothetical protein
LPLPVLEPAFSIPPLAENPARFPSAVPLHAPSIAKLAKQPATQPEARKTEATILTVLLPRSSRVVHFLSRSLSIPTHFRGDFNGGGKF